MSNKEIIYNQIGKRKTAVANAFLKKGTGIIRINNHKIETYFLNKLHECERVTIPLNLLNISKSYDADIYVNGGGISAQVSAIQLAIAKSACKIDQNYRATLSKSFLLNRDSRIKERRKYGLKKARKAPQYSKR